MSGIVVDHKESGVRFAISFNNFDARFHVKVRDLYPWETVISYKPKAKESPTFSAPLQNSASEVGDSQNTSDFSL